MQEYFWILSTFLVPILYLIITTAFYIACYYGNRSPLKGSKIQPENIRPTQFRRELIYSLSSLLIFTVSGYGVFLLHQNGYSLIYLQVNRFDVIYLPISIFLFILFHDFYFYWTHRLLHLPEWYQKIHRVHHLSINPSPFTSLSFHPVEAIIQAAVLPLMIMLIPAHPVAIFCFLIYMVYKNVRGHTGYEFTDYKNRQRGWHRLKNYSIHHNMHHLNCKDNYGLYFTIWDRAMKTFKDEPK